MGGELGRLRIPAKSHSSGQHIQHYCWRPGCCNNHQLDTCVDSIFSVLDEAIFSKLGEVVPSTHRWHTVGPALETQCLGMVCHNVLGRVFNMTTGLDPDDDPEAADQDDQESWNKFCAQQKKKASTFLGDIPKTEQYLMVACMASAPVDRLSARMQHLEHHSHALTELPGLVDECSKHLWLQLNSDKSDNAGKHVHTIIHQFESADLTESTRRTASETTVCIAAQCWARMEAPR